MQVKASPLNPVPGKPGEFAESSNVSMPQLAEGKMRIRVAFLPMNELQHAILADLLPNCSARIVEMAADGLITISRQDHPVLPPKEHKMGTPLWMDIEIGPAPKAPEPPPPAAADEPASPGGARPSAKDSDQEKPAA